MLNLKTEEMKNYFDTLAPYVQETLKQASGDIATLSQLKSAAENLVKKN